MGLSLIDNMHGQAAAEIKIKIFVQKILD